MKMKKGALCLCCAVAALALLCGCSKKTGWAKPYDAQKLDYDATVYYADYGKICLLYDKAQDEFVAREDEDAVVLSNINGGAYSVAVSYAQGQKDMDEAEKTVRETLASGKFSEAGEVSDCEKFGALQCRTLRLLGEDGSAGCVWFGNTASGYFEVYYVLSLDATDAQAEHMLQVVETVSFGQFTDSDIVYVEGLLDTD